MVSLGASDVIRNSHGIRASSAFVSGDAPAAAASTIDRVVVGSARHAVARALSAAPAGWA